MNSKLLLAAGIAVAAAKTEKYIIHYDETAWNTLQLRMLPSNTEHILKELRMQVAELDASEVMEFSTIPGVTLYKDSEVKIADIQPSYVEKNPPSWGLDRIDQRALPLDQLYHYDDLASDVDVWVVDTGVLPEHKEFGGRATLEKNFIIDGKNFDCNGHGTHVSSTIAGETVGIAKGAKIRAVKVLGCDGSGSMTGLVAGLNYVVGEHKKSGRKSVINMSLGGPKNQAVNIAISAAVKSGIIAVVAAGNENQDACNVSPASSPDAFTIAASDSSDGKAYFSNWGKCTDLYAPGHQINGAFIGGNDKYKVASGTSMASPHVAGVAALVLSRGDATTPAEVKKYLIEHGTKDVIKGNVQNTPNVLLYSLKN